MKEKPLMNEVEIVARMIVSRLKTDYRFCIDNVDEFFERIDAWKKEIDSRNTKDSDLKKEFEIFRLAYPGTKRGLEVEYANFIKKYSKEAVSIISQLRPALKREIAYHDRCHANNKFCPEYQHLKTWINNRSWEQVFPEPTTFKATIPQPRETRIKYER